MKQFEFEEMRRIHEAIQKVNSVATEQERKEKEQMLLNAMNKVQELYNLAMKEGLLALEEAVDVIECDSMEGYLKQLILLIVDGTDPSHVEQIGWSRYYASLVKEYTALVYMIYLEGALMIQAGIYPRVLEEKLKVMLPDSLYHSYCWNQERELKETLQESSENRIEKLCSGKQLWNPKDSGYFVMKLADYVLCDIKDKEMELLLREVDNSMLAVAMKGFGGEARRHVFANLSERLGNLIAEDMDYMGPVRMCDVVYAAQEIMLRLIKLIDQGMIPDRYQYLTPFYDVFNVDTEKEMRKTSKLIELQKLINEYEKMGKNVVE